jgi:hypothetical protein
MRRFSFILLSACLLGSLAIASLPAKAGDYYEDGYGYRHRHSSNVWYSSNCCYRKVVRHERRVRYVRVDEERPYYRDRYHERPYRRSYHSGYYSDVPRSYTSTSYVSRGYVDRGYYPYDGYRNYTESCYRRRVPILDGRGGWVWGYRSSCY